MDLSWISLYLECRQNLTHLNGRNVRRELKYSVKGVCLGQIIPHSSNRISRSISIKALTYCKLQCEYYYWNHFAVMRNNCRLRCQWITRDTKALLKVIRHQYQILLQGMSVYPPKTYDPFLMMVTVLFLWSHFWWKIVSLQPCEVAR